MPGGYALFVAGKIFANVTVEGRIGVKLTVPWCFEDLAAMPGAAPWALGKKVMEHWVLLPEALAADDSTLREWVERAFLCVTDKLPSRRADVPPPTARSSVPLPPPTLNGTRTKSNPVREASIPPPIRRPSVPIREGLPPVPSRPAVRRDECETPALPPVARSSKPLVTPPPPSGGFDLSSYAPPPPSSVGIRVVPRDAKSPYEETLVGVPAPPSSSTPLPDAPSTPPRPKRGS